MSPHALHNNKTADKNNISNNHISRPFPHPNHTYPTPSLPAPNSLLPSQDSYPPSRDHQHHPHHSHLRHPYPPLAPPPPPLPPQPLSAISSLIICHPFLPLVLKKFLQLLNLPNSTPHQQLLPYLSETETSAALLSNFANTYGISSASDRWSSTDVFMAALLEALENARSGLREGVPAPNSTFQQTVAAVRVAVTNGLPTNEPLPPKTMAVVSNGTPVPEPSTTDLGVGRAISKNGHTQNGRTPLSEKAKSTLEHWFQDHLKDPYPTVTEKAELARVCGMTMNSVNNWFGNKRMRIKRKMLNVNDGGVNGVGDKVLAPRSKWNAVVVSKMNSEKGKEVVKSATGRGSNANDHADGPPV